MPTLTPVQLQNIYRDTIGEVYAYTSRQTGGDRELSEDVVQEAYLRALKAWRDDGPAAEPAAWLKTVARNLLMSHYRRRRPEGVADVDSVAGDAPVASPEDAAMLHWALGKLRQEQARLIEAFHLEGKRVKEIAAEWRLSERAVEGRLRRARLALREHLNTEYPQGDSSS